MRILIPESVAENRSHETASVVDGSRPLSTTDSGMRILTSKKSLAIESTNAPPPAPRALISISAVRSALAAAASLVRACFGGLKAERPFVLGHRRQTVITDEDSPPQQKTPAQNVAVTMVTKVTLTKTSKISFLELKIPICQES